MQLKLPAATAQGTVDPLQAAGNAWVTALCLTDMPVTLMTHLRTSQLIHRLTAWWGAAMTWSILFHAEEA